MPASEIEQSLSRMSMFEREMFMMETVPSEMIGVFRTLLLRAPSLPIPEWREED